MAPLGNTNRLGKLKDDQPSAEQSATRAKIRKAVARGRRNKSAASLATKGKRERNNVAGRKYRAKKKRSEEEANRERLHAASSREEPARSLVATTKSATTPCSSPQFRITGCVCFVPPSFHGWFKIILQNVPLVLLIGATHETSARSIRCSPR